MTQVLWPRLLEYVVPAQYTGTLKPLCRCLRELAEKKQQEGEEAACLDYSGPVKLPTPQGLLARLLVVASSPYESEGHGCAALQLLKALHHNIHAAVGEMWVLKIPPLLRFIEGNTENSLDHEQWEHMLLQLLFCLSPPRSSFFSHKVEEGKTSKGTRDKGKERGKTKN
nr:maestro heat-like repeat-containing protein family member 1 [Chrysemys picta bellii]